MNRRVPELELVRKSDGVIVLLRDLDVKKGPRKKRKDWKKNGQRKMQQFFRSRSGINEKGHWRRENSGEAHMRKEIEKERRKKGENVKLSAQ